MRSSDMPDSRGSIADSFMFRLSGTGAGIGSLFE